MYLTIRRAIKQTVVIIEAYHFIKTDNNSFARVEDFIYLGTTFKNQNSILEEIKSRL